MNKELLSIIRNLQNINTGQPWYGRPVYEMLEEIDAKIVYTKPNENSHSLIELLYHMITWSEFTLKRIEGDKEHDMAASEKWIGGKLIPRCIHGKKDYLNSKPFMKRSLSCWIKKDDAFLKEIVDYRNYNFRFLLNGLIQHNIYHIGQIAYIEKLLA